MSLLETESFVIEKHCAVLNTDKDGQFEELFFLILKENILS